MVKLAGMARESAENWCKKYGYSLEESVAQLIVIGENFEKVTGAASNLIAAMSRRAIDAVGLSLIARDLIADLDAGNMSEVERRKKQFLEKYEEIFGGADEA